MNKNILFSVIAFIIGEFMISVKLFTKDFFIVSLISLVGVFLILHYLAFLAC